MPDHDAWETERLRRLIADRLARLGNLPD